MRKEVGIGLAGYKFMGRAHSVGYSIAPKVFDSPRIPVLRAVCGRNRAAVAKFAAQWGWPAVETDYRKLVKRDDVGLVDVATPNDSHHAIVLAAIEAGKHVACEKPLALNASQAHEMACAAKEAGLVHTVWFNYRRCPAIALARRLVAEGRIGDIFHVRAVFLQDWLVDPSAPLTWRLKKAHAGSGAHGDLNAHLIDLTRFVTGLEFQQVCGAEQTFIKNRARPADQSAPRRKSAGRRTGKVTVDDALLFLARLDKDVVASFEATRFAAGRKTYSRLEINGSKGSLKWCFERMNELEFYSREDPAHARGFRRILATDSAHPYGEAWWGGGHVLGYDHTFTNQIGDLMRAIADRRRKMQPDFVDGLRCQEVLDAVLESCARKKWIQVRQRAV